MGGTGTRVGAQAGRGSKQPRGAFGLPLLTRKSGLKLHGTGEPCAQRVVALSVLEDQTLDGLRERLFKERLRTFVLPLEVCGVRQSGPCPADAALSG